MSVSSIVDSNILGDETDDEDFDRSGVCVRILDDERACVKVFAGTAARTTTIKTDLIMVVVGLALGLTERNNSFCALADVYLLQGGGARGWSTTYRTYSIGGGGGR